MNILARNDDPHPPKNAGDDAVWGALNDPSRRHMLDLLRQQSMTTGDLCKEFDFTRFAVMKHLKVLESAGLIIVERRGRERMNHLNPLPIQAIYRRWIKPFEQLPADRRDDLLAYCAYPQIDSMPNSVLNTSFRSDTQATDSTCKG